MKSSTNCKHHSICHLCRTWYLGKAHGEIEKLKEDNKYYLKQLKSFGVLEMTHKHQYQILPGTESEKPLTSG